MNKAEAQMHLRAAAAAGQGKSCGAKNKYGTEKAAQIAAFRRNRHPSRQVPGAVMQEPYPCPFCDRWHVGDAMTKTERKRWSRP